MSSTQDTAVTSQFSRADIVVSSTKRRKCENIIFQGSQNKSFMCFKCIFRSLTIAQSSQTSHVPARYEVIDHASCVFATDFCHAIRILLTQSLSFCRKTLTPKKIYI
uniref:Uncharacterized protein n=1 Tax=Cacopsylla melanoneura TaxID=428564 RepID=A0A8D8TWA1_9HEMI